ncbi:MAG: hypothetical protein MUC49_15755 [Raineya sp.]|nr:hypothetical protein [Raineya sp.]
MDLIDSKDELLLTFVKALLSEGELSIFVILKGVCINGTLIPEYKYYEYLADFYEKNSKDKNKILAISAFKDLSEASKSNSNPKIDFIHLKNVVTSSDVGRNKNFIRIKLSEIDAFSLS